MTISANDRQYPSGSQPSRRGRRPRSRLFWISVAVLIFLGLACGGFFLCGGLGLVEIGLGGEGPLALLASRTPTASPTPTPSATASPQPTSTPVPTVTPTPTLTPRPTIGSANLELILPVLQLSLQDELANYDFTTGSDVNRNMAFYPGGWVIAQPYGPFVVFWDLGSGEFLGAVQCSTDIVYGIDFSPDGRFVAAACSDGVIMVWDILTAAVTHTLTGHTENVTSVAFSPDSRLLASGSRDRSVILWDLASGEQVMTLENHTSRVVSLSFSADGRYLASAGSPNDRVNVWEVASGNRVNALPGRLVAFAPDGYRLATIGTRNSLVVYDAESGETVHAFPGEYNSAFAFSADGSLFAAAAVDQVIVWDASTWEERYSFHYFGGYIGELAFSPDGGLLAIYGDGISLWGILGP